jgi:hypothetical protein
MDSSRISRKYNKKGSAVGDLMNPVRGIRDVQRRRGIEPRNHAAENLRILRERQQENRAKKNNDASQESRQRNKFKMKRFQEVKSRVTTDGRGTSNREVIAETARLRDERRVQKEKLTKKTQRMKMERQAKAEEIRKQRQAQSSRPRELRKPAVPKRNEVRPMPTREEKNFIASNLQEMVDAPASPRAVKKLATLQNDDSPTKRDGYGKVPLYLQERKSELAEIAAKKKRDEDNKKAPRGMTLMPEEERLDTLRILKDNLKATKDNLSRMPLLVETPSAIRRKASLERKLQEIEDAINIFSRPKVFIKED